MNKLKLDQAKIKKARHLAQKITQDIYKFIEKHTTTSVERSIARLFGVDGVDEAGIPLPNVLIEHLQDHVVLGEGVAKYLANAVLQTNFSPQEIAEKVARGELNLTALPWAPEDKVRAKAVELSLAGAEIIRKNREERERLIKTLGEGPKPYLYVIVATGNIYEDVKQAQAAARQGADIIAVIRSTGQSLLDYVPHGATTEGFGGTFATRENFRIMRKALDEVSQEVGRYIRLTNYASGLCMPEIAALGALERLDMMLNDSMYGIIFRDINMKRTFIDQYFSRMINAYAGIIINTGEDNYLTTADAYEAAHTVLASNFINEQFALLSGLPEEQMGLGHAMEINPDLEDGFLWEIAQAELIREIFPRAPLKYMPPTKYMTGNIFKGHVQDALFNVASILTGQGIHLLGMLTEAIHTPFLQDRYLSLESAKYIFNNLRHLMEEITFKEDGRIARRAQEVLDKAVAMLEEIAQIGLMEAIARGMFAEIKRLPDGGKGLDGVVPKNERYFNPYLEIFQEGRKENGA